MTKLLIEDIVRYSSQFEEKFTLLGIGPMSPATITASIESAKENDCPVFFIASRNQIESRELGSGYVTGWDQREFAEYIKRKIDELAYEGACYLCRDHGGPWQNDKEYTEKVSREDSMRTALLSYREDVDNGFELLHIDTSKDPFVSGIIPINTAVQRAALLVSEIERYRKNKGGKAITYEVSIEETDGSFSQIAQFEAFIETLISTFIEKKLPLPTFIVGQTGTLTRMMENVGEINVDGVKKMTSISKNNGLVFKEHNTDYLRKESLEIHPELGIGMANVAPEFGKVETSVLVELARLEDRFMKEKGHSELKRSRFAEVLEAQVMKSKKWRKWLPEEMKDSVVDLADDKKLIDDIVLVNGHYFYHDEQVLEAKKKLFENLVEYRLRENPERQVINALKKTIQKYIDAFNLKNLTTKIIQKREMDKRPGKQVQTEMKLSYF